jgi:DNA-binding transcriptional LysR family regulator
LQGRVSVGDRVIHQRLCLDGAGVAVLPEWLVREDVAKKQLRRVLPEWTPMPIELYLFCPTCLSMTPKRNVFLRFMETVLAS